MPHAIAGRGNEKTPHLQASHACGSDSNMQDIVLQPLSRNASDLGGRKRAKPVEFIFAITSSMMSLVRITNTALLDLSLFAIFDLAIGATGKQMILL